VAVIGEVLGRRLAALNTPPVARRWRFLMNMPLESFETLRTHTVSIMRLDHML
jgi:hypothetical protein